MHMWRGEAVKRHAHARSLRASRQTNAEISDKWEVAWALGNVDCTARVHTTGKQIWESSIIKLEA